jgi:UDP-N-acetylglucosamine 2-epimerase (non-hydrolysing)
VTSVLVPVGTRPEIVKLAPVVRALLDAGLSVRTVATGQHRDPELTDTFFESVGLVPDVRWDIDGSHEGDRVAAILSAAYREMAEYQPDIVLVLGDTYTVPLFCLAARRHHVPVVHLEAGLRSFNPTSMEEVNRQIAAATASLHLAPTELAARFLRREGVAPERIRVVGNPVLDVLRARGVRARPPDERTGAVVTAHRATNVDDPDRLCALVDIVVDLAETVGGVTFPVHPRTMRRLDETGLGKRLEAHARLLPPVPYETMLDLVRSACIVVTDSGGLQEEASWLGLPVVVLRRSTPRWEGIEAGAAVLVGLDRGRAREAIATLTSPEDQRRVASLPCPYGDGHTATRVADILCDPATAALLTIDEPDFVGKAVPV